MPYRCCRLPIFLLCFFVVFALSYGPPVLCLAFCYFFFCLLWFKWAYLLFFCFWFVLSRVCLSARDYFPGLFTSSYEVFTTYLLTLSFQRNWFTPSTAIFIFVLFSFVSFFVLGQFSFLPFSPAFCALLMWYSFSLLCPWRGLPFTSAHTFSTLSGGDFLSIPMIKNFQSFKCCSMGAQFCGSCM